MKVTRNILSRLARYDWATTSELKESGLRGPAISASLRRGVQGGLVECLEQPGAPNKYRLTDAGRRFVKEAV
jgi:DNA-binding PadR family transcriptional regulator